MKYRAFVPGFALLAAAAVLAALVPLLFGTPRPMVHVTWRGLDAPERARLEQRFGLSEPTPLGGDAWSYVPLDTSRSTLAALVRLESVVTTDGIDRTTFRISRTAPLTERRGGMLRGVPPIASRLARLIEYALALAGVLLLARAVAGTAGSPISARIRGGDPRGAATAIATWLGRGVPAVPPRALAAFRITFGAFVTAYVWSEPVYPELLGVYELGAAGGVYGAVVRALSEHPWLVDGIRYGVLASGVAFIAGLRPRAAFAALTFVVMLWACVLTLRTTAHTVSALLLTMVCLLPARWGHAWRIDSWHARRNSSSIGPNFSSGNTGANDAVSGFPIWVPVFVLGVTFAAAAWAKMRNGLDWIVNGTVKYHFISDLEHAWVDWGVWLTQSHAVAVALSAAAVAIEAVLITAAFSRSDGYRLAMGGAAMALLAGFALFQGVVWLGWWILLVGFLPWGLMARPTATGISLPMRLRPAELAVVLFVIGQQVFASAGQVEARPLVTAYDMYSTTYDSPDDYEAASNLVYRVVGIAGGTAADLGCVVDDTAARAVQAAARGDERARERVKGLLAPCVSKRPDVTMLRLEGDRQVYDWERRSFRWRKGLDVVGPVRVDWLRE